MCGGYLHALTTCAMIIKVANLVDDTWDYFGSHAGVRSWRREASV